MNIVVAQSGGPTCAINASLLGVFKGAMKSRDIHGYGAVAANSVHSFKLMSV